MTESEYMQRALELAVKGWGWVNPNPQVGAVIVKDGRIIGEGYHRRYGEAHAEREAIASCVETPEGATLYVTLEPCCHCGKTPPCTEAIIASGITAVVIGSHDPNPRVAGRGIAQLREAGIKVTAGFMEQECDKINRIFFHYIQNRTPYTLLKYAMTLDGKLATRTGDSSWITGEQSRENVHYLRGRYAAIMVGMGTVVADDPLLNCRLEGGHNPVRVICDSSLSIALTSQIVTTAFDIPTLIATVSTNEMKRRQLEDRGCELMVVPSKGKHLDLAVLMQMLGERNIDSVLLEGGSALQGAAFDEGVLNAVRCYVAPKLFGGSTALSPVGGQGVAAPCDALRLTNIETEVFGDDLCITGEVL